MKKTYIIYYYYILYNIYFLSKCDGKPDTQAASWRIQRNCTGSSNNVPSDFTLDDNTDLKHSNKTRVERLITPDQKAPAGRSITPVG